MKRLCGILLALAGLFLYAPCAAQNTRVRGTVTDAQTGEPIPYAVVLFPGTTTGITTDDEGFYSLESRDTSSYIRAEMVSYEPQIRPVHVGGYNQIDFRLTPSHLEIESVVITPGDNPAHPILEGIIRNKKYNDSKEYDRYICRTYTKMELGLANIREFRSKKLQQNFGFIFEHLDTSSVTGQPYLPVMISETAADYYHSRTPSVAREVIRASQISGIEDNSVLAQFTGHLHADVNLYENFIDLFGVKFASPLSNSGRSFYKYFLVDSTNVEGRKTYKIRFHPKSVATPVLDGEVNIDSASYALRSARVKMAKGVNVNWIRHLAIEADNRLTADSLWFPQREKMTADFTLTKSDSSKMIAFLGSHEVTYSDVKFDTPIPKQVLGTSASVILSDDAISGKQVEWDSLRPYTLTQKEKAIYQMVDSIQQVPLYKNIYTVLNTIIGGYYNTKYVGIGPYSKVISFNRLEGARFQIGARTTKEFSRRVRLSTYLAYGTRDEDFKGAAEVELMLRRQLLRKLTVTYRNDAIQLSSGVSALSENNILSSIFSRGGTSRLSTIEEGIALYEHEWLHGISSSFELRGRHISSNRYVPMILPDGRSLHGINDASIRIGLRLSKDETIVRMPFEVRHMGSKYPIFSFDFTGAKRGVLPASYDYLRLEGRMQYRLNLPPIGYSQLMLEGGKIFGKVPYLLLKLHEGNGTYFYDRYAFSCMNFYEFSSDAWISFFYEHHFNGFLLGAPLLGLTGHPLISTLGIAGAAWIGSALILMLIAAVSRRIKDIMVILILGMMFSSGVGAVVQILQYLSNEAALKSFVVWTMGSLGDVTLGQLGLLLPAVVLGLVLAVAVIKPLNLLLLGENYARTMGLDIRRSRQLIFLSTTLLAGTVTAFCGPIGFIGLAVPHVARILFADADHRILVPASILTGIVVMLLCDVLAKLLTFPINTITALLGIPIVIWVVIRNKSIV